VFFNFDNLSIAWKQIPCDYPTSCDIPFMISAIASIE